MPAPQCVCGCCEPDAIDIATARHGFRFFRSRRRGSGQFALTGASNANHNTGYQLSATQAYRLPFLASFGTLRLLIRKLSDSNDANISIFQALRRSGAFCPIRSGRSLFGTAGRQCSLMLALGLLGLVAFALFYWRKRKLQDSVETQFRSFRERAVALMDQLDGLRQRHKTLTATDPDFKVPMTGATLALYNQVSRELDGLWERWLKLMEIWDKAQKHIRAGTGLATKPTEEARRLLAGGEVDELVRQSTACKEQLDHLNQGHEDARANLAAARAELAAARSAVSKGTGVLIPSDPHHSEMSEAERMLGEADSMIASDPIGALERIAEARRAFASLHERS